MPFVKNKKKVHLDGWPEFLRFRSSKIVSLEKKIGKRQ